MKQLFIPLVLISALLNSPDTTNKTKNIAPDDGSNFVCVLPHTQTHPRTLTILQNRDNNNWVCDLSPAIESKNFNLKNRHGDKWKMEMDPHFCWNVCWRNNDWLNMSNALNLQQTKLLFEVYMRCMVLLRMIINVLTNNNNLCLFIGL